MSTVLTSVRVHPALDAKLLRTQLESYVQREFLIDSIIQLTREKARLTAFGIPDENIQYMEQVVRLACHMLVTKRD